MSVNKVYIFKSDTKVRVRYGETDQMGYCYYGNYAEYFEVGRVEALRELGMTYKALEESGYMLPVSTLSVKYLLPAFYDDLLTVTTKVVSLKGVRLLFEYEIRNNKEELLVVGETLLVFVNKKTMKPTAPPEYFVKLLNSKS